MGEDINKQQELFGFIRDSEPMQKTLALIREKERLAMEISKSLGYSAQTTNDLSNSAHSKVWQIFHKKYPQYSQKSEEEEARYLAERGTRKEERRKEREKLKEEKMEKMKNSETETIRCLTLHQPWGSAFFSKSNPKDVENRSWCIESLYYELPFEFYIHVGCHKIWRNSRKKAENFYRWMIENNVELPDMVDLPFSAIIGKVFVVDIGWELDMASMWGMPGHYHYIIDTSKSRKLIEPIPVGGRQKFWNLEVEKSLLVFEED